MKKLLFYFLLAGLTACTSKTNHPHNELAESKTLIVTVVDYSQSYQSLVTLDSEKVQSLYSTVAKSGGTLVHIGIQDNSNRQSVYLTRIGKLDTMPLPTNMYQAARFKQQNKRIAFSFKEKMQQQVAQYMTHTRTYTVSKYTDLQHSLELAHTVCEPIYTQGNHPYRRFVLVLSDMLNDPPRKKRNAHLMPIDFCNATVLVVRPSPAISLDSLQTIFHGAEVYTFTTIDNAISFINEQ